MSSRKTCSDAMQNVDVRPSAQSLEITASPVAADAHSDGSPAAATLADVFGSKENMVGCVSSRAQAAQGAARSKVREDLIEAAAG